MSPTPSNVSAMLRLDVGTIIDAYASATSETVIDKWKCLHGSEQRCEVDENGMVLKKRAGGAAEGESGSSRCERERRREIGTSMETTRRVRKQHMQRKA